VLHSVLGFVFGCLALSLVFTVAGLATLPAWYWSLPAGAQFGIWNADDLWEAFAVASLALPLAALTIVALRGMALAECALAASLLAFQGQPRRLTSVGCWRAASLGDVCVLESQGRRSFASSDVGLSHRQSIGSVRRRRIDRWLKESGSRSSNAIASTSLSLCGMRCVSTTWLSLETGCRDPSRRQRAVLLEPMAHGADTAQ